MLNQSYIRTQVMLIANAGAWTEQAIRNICAEAERHAQDCAIKATQGTLYEIAPDQRYKLASADLKTALAVITTRREIMRIGASK